MSVSENLIADTGLNFILARFVAGLWNGQDQFAVPEAQMIRAYGSTDPDPPLRELGEGWSAACPDQNGDTIFTRIIPARMALEQLGF